MRLGLSSHWARGLATALAFALLAWGIRHWTGYPLCRADEMNWIDIARQLDRGVPWPVSGPVFIGTVRGLSDELQIRHPRSIALLGIGGVFAVLLVLQWAYRQLELVGTGLTLAALALSSYFWAPLLEARPQQWGQALVFGGAVCCWQWLHRGRGGLAFFVLLPLVAVTHILSHALLAWVCAALLLANAVEHRGLTWRHALAAMALLASVGVYAWPGGPYAPMLQDVQHNHLPRLLPRLPMVCAVLLGVCGALVATRRHWHWRPAWTQAVARFTAQRRLLMKTVAMLLLGTALVTQAAMLPPQAWQLYGGSLWRFVVFQLGNLLFGALFLQGSLHVLARLSGDQQAKVHAVDADDSRRFMAWSLLAFAALGGATLLASRWMLDTNWFLRLINYAMPFAAPLAAIGLRQMLRACGAWVTSAVCAPACVLSLVAVIRPPGVLGC